MRDLPSPPEKPKRLNPLSQRPLGGEKRFAIRFRTGNIRRGSAGNYVFCFSPAVLEAAFGALNGAIRVDCCCRTKKAMMESGVWITVERSSEMDLSGSNLFANGKPDRSGVWINSLRVEIVVGYK